MANKTLAKVRKYRLPVNVQRSGSGCRPLSWSARAHRRRAERPPRTIDARPTDCRGALREDRPRLGAKYNQGKPFPKWPAELRRGARPNI